MILYRWQSKAINISVHNLLTTNNCNIKTVNITWLLNLYLLGFIKYIGSNKIYLRGINLELWVAPIPGRPCFTGLYVMANSAK